ncbi:hypothetical protein RCC89_03990 [Cytophagaceae bacterium ABcell3]|nr:hypothetical protein RCC89_03990 [Cytophagaceae bacterium ABcell3]
MNLHFNEKEQDFLKEIVNTGSIKAADAFATIAKEKVLVHVPDLKIIEWGNFSQQFSDFEKHTIVSETTFSGDLEGAAFVMYTEKEAEELAKVCLVNKSFKKFDYETINSSLIKEVSNILSVSALSKIGDMLDLKVMCSSQRLNNNYIVNLLSNLNNRYPLFQPILLTVHTQFIYSYKTMKFPFVIIFDLNSLYNILSKIRSGNIKF